MNKLENSFKILGLSWGVLKKNKSLLKITFLSIVVTSLFMFVVSIPTITFLANQSDTMSSSNVGLVGIIFVFIFYFVLYAILLYFTSAQTAIVLSYLDGKPVDSKYGFQVANMRLGVLLQYALIASTVGVALSYLREKGGVFGNFVGALGGLVWNVVTFLTVPILVVKGVSPMQAIRESASLLKKTWGETLVGSISLGLATLIIALPFFLVVGLLAVIAYSSGSMIFGAIAVVLFIIALFVTILLSSSLSVIYQAILYRYAVIGDTSGLDVNILRSTFVQTK